MPIPCEEIIIKQHLTNVGLAALLGICLVYFLWRIGKTAYAHFHEKEQLAVDYRQQQLEESERLLERISYDIHENMANDMSMINTLILEARKSLEDTTGLRHLATASGLAKKVIAQARQISRLLNGDFIIATGLEYMIRTSLELHGYKRHGGYQLKIRGDLEQLPDEVKLIAYRIAQEAITNIKKHSTASKVNLTLSYIEERFVMRITDSGQGFVLDQASKTSMGLRDMYARAKHLGGQLRIDTKPGDGTSIELIVENLPGAANQD